MQKGGIRGAWFETRLHWEVISTHHLPVVGCTRRRKLPLRSFVCKYVHCNWNEYKLLPHYNVSSQDHGHFEYLLPSTYSWDYSNCGKFGNQDMIPNVMFKTRLTKNGLIFTNIIKCCETFISWCFYFFMFKQQHHIWTLNFNSNF